MMFLIIMTFPVDHLDLCYHANGDKCHQWLVHTQVKRLGDVVTSNFIVEVSGVSRVFFLVARKPPPPAMIFLNLP